VLRLYHNFCCIFQLIHNAIAATNLTQVRTEYTRPGYGSRYGFTNWPMKKDYHKRECVKDQYVTRMRLNAIRKNKILPKELRVNIIYLVHHYCMHLTLCKYRLPINEGDCRIHHS